MNTEKIIKECSGLAGITNFKNMPREQFKEWFFNNIQFNDEESKNLGLELLKTL